MNILKSLPFMAIILLLTSCAHNIYVKHNSFANTKAIPFGFPRFASFTVEPLHDNDLMLSQEITTKIEHLLLKNNYALEKEMKAQYYLLFDYHITRYEKTVHVKKYVPSQTFISHKSKLSHGKTQECTDETETLGTYVDIPEIHTYFNKTITIQVFDAEDYRANAHSKPIWQETASCCDENDDLRDSIDYILVTAFEFFGRNTQKNLEIVISSDDKDVASLRTNVFHAYGE